jgi:hypothetical protein
MYSQNRPFKNVRANNMQALSFDATQKFTAVYPTIWLD